jgi:hypothetical protein
MGEWIEWVFFVPSVVGFLTCWWAFNSAVRDLHWLEASGLNGAREVVAKAATRNEFVRTVIQVQFLSLGIAAILDMRWLGPLVALVIVDVEILLVIKALLDRRDRRRVIAILSRRDNG